MPIATVYAYVPGQGSVGSSARGGMPSHHPQCPAEVLCMAHETSLSPFAPPNAPLTHVGGSIRAIGIDLGTTNSTVAEVHWQPGGSTVQPRCVEVDQHTLEGLYTHVLVPSVVVLHGGTVHVGEGAKRLRSRTGELALRQNRDVFFDCKNDIGLRRTYHLAPEGFRSATEIAGRVLAFLDQAVKADDAAPAARVVVTVPASFGAAQRLDTREAARLAGITLGPGDLLDEPIAAFLAALVSHDRQPFEGLDGRRRLLVFDFGGGTCDIAIIDVHASPGGASAAVAPLSVSRYHRLGGGDIDAAIVHEVLIPQLVQQNRLSPHDLTFENKKRVLEPALLGLAEALKVGLCSEIRRLESFGKYATADKSVMEKVQPGLHRLQLGDRELVLQSPRLTAAEFEELLVPFLDEDLLYHVDGEYRSSCSIFAPISDALERARLDAADIDMLLVVGGSSLIPQVRTALHTHFRRARMLVHSDAVDVQTAVARGAACHALTLAAFGRGLVQPLAHDDISIRTSAGLMPLVSAGTLLPSHDPEGFVRCELAVPETVLMGTCSLRVEVVTGRGDSERILCTRTWQVRGPVNKGDAIHVRCSLDENQILDLELRLADTPSADVFQETIENPLTHIVNPARESRRIDEREEALRRQQVPPEEVPDALVSLADDYRDLRHREKALEYLKRALRLRGGADGYILNKLGILAGELGDTEREDKYYREAAKVMDPSTPLFNLALAQLKRKDPNAAWQTISAVIDRDREAPSLVLGGRIAAALGDHAQQDRLFAEARRAFPRPVEMNDFELGWATYLARTMPDTEWLDACNQERQRRDTKVTWQPPAEGLWPDLRGAMTRVAS